MFVSLIGKEGFDDEIFHDCLQATNFVPELMPCICVPYCYIMGSYYCDGMRLLFLLKYSHMWFGVVSGIGYNKPFVQYLRACGD